MDERMMAQGEAGETAVSPTYWWRQHPKPTCQTPTPKPGGPCPTCGAGILAYDGLFVLTCPACGHCAESGAFT